MHPDLELLRAVLCPGFKVLLRHERHGSFSQNKNHGEVCPRMHNDLHQIISLMKSIRADSFHTFCLKNFCHTPLIQHQTIARNMSRLAVSLVVFVVAFASVDMSILTFFSHVNQKIDVRCVCHIQR
jgi:hypothetical protein